MNTVLFSSAVLASFLGGVVALLAPCCISVMLPAFLASGAPARGRRLAVSGRFAAGVATIVLPMTLGASAVGRVVNGHHRAVFGAAALGLMTMGAASLSGRQVALPMLSVRPAPGGGGAYVLGVVSGAASACCAPVVAGVLAVAGASGSFPAALALGGSYVAGMVLPLFVAASLWDRRGVRGAGLATWLERRPRLRSALPGSLMVLLGLMTAAFALTGPHDATNGWQLQVTARLQHWAAVLTRHLDWLPGWLVLLALGSVVVLLIRRYRLGSRSAQPPAGLTELEASNIHDDHDSRSRT
jgi:cytochrome c-type biogenesis protein